MNDLFYDVYLNLSNIPKYATSEMNFVFQLLNLDLGASTADITSHHPGGWSSKIKVSAGLVSPESSLLGLHMDLLNESSHGLSSVCTHLWCLYLFL